MTGDSVRSTEREKQRKLGTANVELASENSIARLRPFLKNARLGLEMFAGANVARGMASKYRDKLLSC